MKTIFCPECDLKMKLNPQRIDENGKLKCPKCGYEMHVNGWEIQR